MREEHTWAWEQMVMFSFCDKCGAMCEPEKNLCDICEALSNNLSKYMEECQQTKPKDKKGGSTEKPTGKENPLDQQHGGDHYKKLAIQPMEYAMLNKLNYAQSNAIKYVTRYNLKGNGAEDICKAIHCLDLLLQLEYGRSYKELTE